MDEPFRKRPRLAMFADQSSDAELDRELGGRRQRNDSLLKSRFESIFEKYSHDFAGVGDEIDLVSGAVVVNNGHLEGMENETDPGSAKGQLLLKAMTRSSDAEDSDTDNVMLSIEEIAEIAAPSEDEASPVNSDDELFAPVHPQPSFYTPPESQGSNNAQKSDPQDPGSDADSLFEVQRRERSSSPDSLFEVRTSIQPDQATPGLESPALEEDVNDDTILEKFGPLAGQEVLAIVERARNAAAQAHIEPAWRIPTNIIPPRAQRSSSRSETPKVPILPRPQTPTPKSPEHGLSLWKTTKQQFMKRPKRQVRAKRRVRAESEDPLQEDFHSRREDQNQGFDSDGDSEWVEEDDEEPTLKRRGGEDEQLVLMREGTCYYCSRKWASRDGVYRHWTKLAKEFENDVADPDDGHDLEYIHQYCSFTSQGPRQAARLVVSDFRTMVELHEGAGLSFIEIAECRALRTRKKGHALNDIYDRYRNPPGTTDPNGDRKDWSEKELEILNDLPRNPRRDVGTFVLELPGRSNTEIGDKLAEIWLKELEESRPVVDGRLGVKKEDGESKIASVFIKPEPSDDELFGPG